MLNGNSANDIGTLMPINVIIDIMKAIIPVFTSQQQFNKDCPDANYGDILLPIRKTKNSAGYDFISFNEITLMPGEIKKIPTGIKVRLNDDEFLSIYVRSSMGFKYNIRMCNQVGIIDADYYNNSDNEGIDLGSIFETVVNCPSSSFVIIHDLGKSFILNKYTYELLHNMFFDGCYYTGVYFKVCLDKKYNIIDKKGNFFFDRWYDDITSLIVGTFCVYDGSVGKWGLYKGSDTKLLYDDVNKCISYQHGCVGDIKNDYIEVVVNNSYNLIDLDHERFEKLKEIVIEKTNENKL